MDKTETTELDAHHERMERLDALMQKGKILFRSQMIMDTVYPLLDPEDRSEKRNRRYSRVIESLGRDRVRSLIEHSTTKEWKQCPLFFALVVRQFVRDHEHFAKAT